jgi:hypothetical protein
MSDFFNFTGIYHDLDVDQIVQFHHFILAVGDNGDVPCHEFSEENGCSSSASSSLVSSPCNENGDYYAHVIAAEDKSFPLSPEMFDCDDFDQVWAMLDDLQCQEQFGDDVALTQWRYKHMLKQLALQAIRGNRNNIPVALSRRFLKRQQWYLRRGADLDLMERCIVSANDEYDQELTGGRNPQRHFLERTEELYHVPRDFMKVVTPGGLNGLTPDAAVYHRALLMYHDSIPAYARSGFLEQCSIAAAVGASDPLVELYPILC